MVECLKMYLVSFTEPALGFRIVIARSYRIEGEHLIFLAQDGKVAALFLLELVEHWSSTDIATA
jgi:hypothetical protein